MSQYDPRDFYEPGNQAGNQQGNQPDPEDARYMPRDLRVEPREYQRGTSRPNPDARPGAQRRRLLAPVLAVVGLMVFFAIVWFAWTSGQTTASEGGMPLIKADNGPVKMRPEQPGGMAVPHQDKLIYDRLKAETGSTEAAAVERLLPPPENPLPRPETPPPPEAIEEPPTSGLPPSAMDAPVPQSNGLPADPACPAGSAAAIAAGRGYAGTCAAARSGSPSGTASRRRRCRGTASRPHAASPGSGTGADGGPAAAVGSAGRVVRGRELPPSDRIGEVRGRRTGGVPAVAEALSGSPGRAGCRLCPGRSWRQGHLLSRPGRTGG